MGKDKGYNNNNYNTMVFSSSTKRGSGCSNSNNAPPRRSASCGPSTSKAEREILRLRSALEAERGRHKDAQHRFSQELGRVREEGRQEREQALRELTSRQERQRASALQRQREALSKEHAAEVRQLRRWRERERERTGATLKQAQELQRLLAKELCGAVGGGIGNTGPGGIRDSTGLPGKPDPQDIKTLLGGRSAGGGGGGAVSVYCKLEELLARLHGQASGEQALLLQGLRQELELEKSRFICHLLEKHGHAQSTRPSTAPGEEAAEAAGAPPVPAPPGKEAPHPIPAPRRNRHRSTSCAQILSRPASQQGQDGTPGGGDAAGNSSGNSRGASPTCARSQSQRAQRSSQQQQQQQQQQQHGGPPKRKQRSRSMRGGGGGLTLSPGKPQRCSSPVESQKEANSNSEGGPATSSSSSSEMPQTPDNSTPSRCSVENMEDVNGMDYGFLVRQNSELLRALDDLDKTCATLREENSLLRKSSSPETEEKVKRLRKKNTELAVIAKRLEDRARKLQEANLKVVNSPFPVKAGAVEQYKRAFARQRARDLAQHADTLLSKDKEITALQQECRELQSHMGHNKGVPGPCAVPDFERLLRESQKEVLRLQRQLSVSICSSRENTPDTVTTNADTPDPAQPADITDKAAAETPPPVLDEAPPTCEETPAEEEEPGPRVTPEPSPSPSPTPTPTQPHPEEQTQEQRIQFLESELSKKRKECESLEQNVKKRQKRCLDLESQLDEERGKNERLAEEAELLRRKAQLLDQSQAENEELRQELSEVSALHSSALEENQRLRAKLENLEQVLKHMREVAERRQQLELEHESALAILKFKQDEIKRLHRAQLFAKREHEGVVQMLEDLIQLVLQRELSKVRELEDKCRSQSEQFGMLSHELEKFRLQASKVDVESATLLSHPGLAHLTNGLPGDTVDVEALLRLGSSPHGTGLSRPERSPTTKHRELPSISAKSASTSSTTKSDPTHLSPRSPRSPHSPRKASPTHDVDTASEVEELDIDVSPAPYNAIRGAAKLQVFIARYSYNPYDGPNDSPEVELPLTAGEYIYVYGDMDDDGFYEGELMDGRRGLVPSNFVERVSDDDMMSAAAHEAGDLSHNSLLDSSLHSGSERFQHHSLSQSQSHSTSHPHAHHVRFGPSVTGPTITTISTTTTNTPAAAAAVVSSDISAASLPDPVSSSSPSLVGKTAPVPSTTPSPAPSLSVPITNGLDLDLEEVDVVPYPRKLTLIKQLAKSIIIGWEPPQIPVSWASACSTSLWSYNVYVDQELRASVPFGSQTKAVLERVEVGLRAYRVCVQCLTERGGSDQLRCSLLVGRDVCVAPSQLRVERVTATSATLLWLPSNSNYVHIVSLNEEECELVKAGCYSLCLSNLTPSLQYRVKVEARPHRTPWELPPEQREQKTTTAVFNTLPAGPPDAPLDVQLEQGPSPGIATVSWLPVTIDAAGTSNGVPVTGYTLYADKRKVLEVASPTAGSALLGPSQIQAVKSAQELTVRTMSPHGESTDSLAVNVQAKLPAIMAGPAIQPPSQPVPVLAATATAVPIAMPAATMPSCLANSPAKMPALPYSLPPPPQPDAHTMVPGGGAYANPTTANAPLLATANAAPSYAEVWANPHVPVPPVPMPVAPVPVPVPMAMPMPVSVSVPAAMAMQQPPATLNHPAVCMPQVSVAVPPSVHPPLEPSGSPVPEAQRPVISINEFLEQHPPSANQPQQPQPRPLPAPVGPGPAPVGPAPVPYDSNPMRPPNPSPFESEVEEELENTRLASIEEFLRPARQQAYPEPSLDYQLESSRGSDLSDILEEEEEDLYSETGTEVRIRGYGTAITGRPLAWEPDSDEEVLERILKLPAHVYHAKQLFSIPEEEDHYTAVQQPAPQPLRSALRNPSGRPTAQPRGAAGNLRRPQQHRVHYADQVATIAYSGEDEEDAASDSSLYDGPDSHKIRSRRAPASHSPADRLRREVMLRNQMSSHVAETVTAALKPPPASCSADAYLVSRTVRRTKSPPGTRVEIDLEYGTDDGQEEEAAPAVTFDPSEVVVDQMSSEWWVEGGHHTADCRRPPPATARRLIPPPHTWDEAAQAQMPPQQAPMKVDDNAVRVFVALFPYDPASMSPNPDAAEEELPFREGQIIKVYGDKDADGFFRGECNGRMGYVPCNMVSEIQVDDMETRDQLLQQGFLTTEASLDKIGTTRSHAQLPRRPVPPPKPRRSKKVESAGVWDDSSVVDSSSQDRSQSGPATGNPGHLQRRMVAIFDYDPRESSPNADIDAELTFSAGDIIYVFGDMDADGFFFGDLNGHKGLVPSNFLQPYPEVMEEVPGAVAGGASRDHHVVIDARRDLPVNEKDVSMHSEGPMAGATTEDSPPRPETGADPEPGPSVSHLHDSLTSPSYTPMGTPATDESPLTDSSLSGKKKMGFFSKGKRLFKKLGSSKKE
ncbi:peripheral-type benzodiazepine receptor-associated protein 1-like isoform X3 [Engraulis encrasicolus]|uniref:peripheral-type benzodiazepine receptor-associated protein 1-like isoform X3 n=1 Tax=Engraulis encrasicolus TaxID=184585 RepID=UPI002FD2757B